jgi:hypothetical protein
MLWWTVFVLSLTLLIPLVWSFQYLAVGSGSYVIAQFNGVLLGVLALGSSILLYVGWDPF